MNSQILFLLLIIAATVNAQCIALCSNIFTDQLSCQGPNSNACNCKVYETDVPPCVSCQLAAGESPADVAVYTSLLATYPGGIAYLSTILSPHPTTLTHSTTTPGRSALTTTSTSTSTSSPAHTATSTTLATATSTSPVISSFQAIVTLVSGESKIKASTVALLVLVMVVAIVG